MKILKPVLIVLGILVVCMFAPPLFFGVVNSGNVFGIALGVFVLMCGVFCQKVRRFLCEMRKRKWGMAVLAVAAIILTMLVGFGAVMSVRIYRASDNPPDKPTTAVVLGCQVKPHGPGILLEERLVAAKKFLDENPSAKCVLSGGQGDDEPISEAECMRNWLVEKGVDPQRLFMEDKSTTTAENLEFSKQLIEEQGLVPEITIISNDFHQFRAGKIAESLGVEYYNVSCSTNPAFFSTYFMRELGGAMIDEILKFF